MSSLPGKTNPAYKHGMSGTKPFLVYQGMKARCMNPRHSSYANYGARGVRVCARWMRGFEYFWKDMSAGYAPGLMLDRINPDGDYSPRNCRWATRKANMRNRRWAIIRRYPHIPHNFLDITDALGLSRLTVYQRIHAGKSWSEIIDRSSPRMRRNGGWRRK